MLKPTKYTDMNVAVLTLGAEILRVLKKPRSVKYDELFERVVARRGVRAKPNFLPALSFLFLIGKIKYHQEVDVVELSNNENQ